MGWNFASGNFFGEGLPRTIENKVLNGTHRETSIQYKHLLMRNLGCF